MLQYLLAPNITYRHTRTVSGVNRPRAPLDFLFAIERYRFISVTLPSPTNVP